MRKSIIVAKTMDAKGAEAFWEVLRTGAVTFDKRPDWVLIASPIGAALRKQDLRWVHPTELQFVWIRPFSFTGQAVFDNDFTKPLGLWEVACPIVLMHRERKLEESSGERDNG